MSLAIRAVILLSICFSCQAWLILNDTKITCPGVIYPHSQQRFDIVEGRVVYDNSSDITGKIVVSHLGFSTAVRDIQNRGAIGVIFVDFARKYDVNVFINKLLLEISLFRVPNTRKFIYDNCIQYNEDQMKY